MASLKFTQPCYLRPYKTVKDSKGNVSKTYADSVKIDATVSASTSKVQAETYGEKAKNMLTLLYEGNETVKNGDGFCIYVEDVEEPDYRVSANPKRYSRHMVVELESL